MSNETLKENAMKAINDLFSDMSVPVSTCRDNLEYLRGEIDMLLDSLSDEEENYNPDDE